MIDNDKDGFYGGRIGQALVDVVQANGGALTLEDLAAHNSTYEDPIHTSYHGIDVWEIAPNGQGLTALIALNILEEFQMKGEYVYVHFGIKHCLHQAQMVVSEQKSVL